MGKRTWRIGSAAVSSFLEDRCPRMAAALSYYMLFSLPALLVIIISIVGIFIDTQQAQDRVMTEIRSFVGERGAGQVETMIKHSRQTGQSTGGALAGIVVLLIGTTGVIVELQTALNDVWNVKPGPNVGVIGYFLRKRLVAFLLILAVALLLLISLLMQTILTSFGEQVATWLSKSLSRQALSLINGSVTLALLILLLAAIFKQLPEAEIRWRHVWLAAVFTAILFGIGRRLLGLYFSYSNVASGYGAAGSLALILVWIYYSSMILLLGAEVSRAWAERRGDAIPPEPGAIRVEC